MCLFTRERGLNGFVSILAVTTHIRFGLIPSSHTMQIKNVPLHLISVGVRSGSKEELGGGGFLGR